jgi:hypothetical protein
MQALKLMLRTILIFPSFPRRRESELALQRFVHGSTEARQAWIPVFTGVTKVFWGILRNIRSKFEFMRLPPRSSPPSLMGEANNLVKFFSTHDPNY